MSGQSVVKPTDGGQGFRSVIARWSKDVEGISHFEKPTLRKNPWLRGRGKLLMAMVSKVGEALQSFLKRFPKMNVAACNALLFGGAIAAIADLFLDALATRVQEAITNRGVIQAKAFAIETFQYVKPRLEKLDIHGQDFDRTDHQSRSDIEDCIGKLVEAEPVIESGISKLDRSWMVASGFNVIFGVAGIAGFVSSGLGWSMMIVCCIPWILLTRVTTNYTDLKKHFVTYQGTCKEIIDGLSKAKKGTDIGQSEWMPIYDFITT